MSSNDDGGVRAGLLRLAKEAQERATAIAAGLAVRDAERTPRDSA
jgi:hypothetical protein